MPTATTGDPGWLILGGAILTAHERGTAKKPHPKSVTFVPTRETSQLERKSAKARQSEQGDVKEEGMMQSNLTPLHQQGKSRRLNISQRATSRTYKLT